MTDLVFVVPPDQPTTTSSVIKIGDPIAVVGESVRVHQLAPPPVASQLLTERPAWSWQQLRDYVVGKIFELHGPDPRNDKKELGIFKAFADRWGADAPDIARYAMEVMGGFWKNAPVSVNRFCKGSDPYFAKPILDHLNRNVR
jgi:hypothetical protein